jgi:Flp pilus assembly protein TadD
VRYGFSLLIAVAALVMVMPPIPSVAAFKYIEPGMTAPEVSGEDLVSGKKVSSSDRSGDERETVCVAFWASWSPRSLELLTDLKTIANRLTGQPLRVIAVNVDSQVTTSSIKQRVKQLVSDLEPSFPVIVDDGLKFFYEFGVMAVPSYVILDADGIARYTPSGYSYSMRDSLVDRIERVLGLSAPEEDVVAKQSYQPKTEAAHYYYLAVQLSNQRLYEDALEKVELAIAADTLFSAPCALRGHIRLELGETAPAEVDFQQAVALDSSSVNARAGLGRALLENGDPASAKEVLDSALKLDPSFTAALQDMARCLAAMGEMEQAVAVLQEAIALYPQDPQMYYYLGRIYRDAGRPSLAVNAYRRSLEMVFPRP